MYAKICTVHTLLKFRQKLQEVTFLYHPVHKLVTRVLPLTGIVDYLSDILEKLFSLDRVKTYYYTVLHVFCRERVPVQYLYTECLYNTYTLSAYTECLHNTYTLSGCLIGQYLCRNMVLMGAESRCLFDSLVVRRGHRPSSHAHLCIVLS